MLASKIALSQLKSNCYKPQTHPRKSKFVRTLVVNVLGKRSRVHRNGLTVNHWPPLARLQPSTGCSYELKLFSFVSSPKFRLLQPNCLQQLNLPVLALDLCV